MQEEIVTSTSVYEICNHSGASRRRCQTDSAVSVANSSRNKVTTATNSTADVVRHDNAPEDADQISSMKLLGNRTECALLMMLMTLEEDYKEARNARKPLVQCALCRVVCALCVPCLVSL